MDSGRTRVILSSWQFCTTINEEYDHLKQNYEVLMLNKDTDVYTLKSTLDLKERHLGRDMQHRYNGENAEAQSSQTDKQAFWPIS